MIRNETQCRATLARLDRLEHQLVTEQAQLRRIGLREEKIEQLVGNLISDCENLDEEIATYKLRTARNWVTA